jgi:hypothetical protein
MHDIVELLRDPGTDITRKEAADEIERLRSALQSIANNACCDGCQEAALVAKSALRPVDAPSTRLPFHDETIDGLNRLTIR